MDTLEVRVRADTLWVTIARPQKRNALSGEVLRELEEVFTRQSDNRELRMAVLTGAGNASFAAGGDLRELMSVTGHEDALRMSETTRKVIDRIRYFPVPVVAALNGDALGGGAELALAPDFRVAAGHARIAFVQGRLNVSTAWGGGIDLTRRVGFAKALHLLGTRRYVGAEEGLEIGLIDAVAAPGQDVAEKTEEFIQPFLQQIPAVLRAFKALAVAVRQGLPQRELEELETRLLADNWVSRDHWDAAAKVIDSLGASTK